MTAPQTARVDRDDNQLLSYAEVQAALRLSSNDWWPTTRPAEVLVVVPGPCPLDPEVPGGAAITVPVLQASVALGMETDEWTHPARPGAHRHDRRIVVLVDGRPLVAECVGLLGPDLVTTRSWSVWTERPTKRDPLAYVSETPFQWLGRAIDGTPL